jgi:hypothetical protein
MVILDTIWTRRKKMADQRLNVCRECQHFEKSTTRCDKCGCFMAAKAFLSDAKCPLDLWPENCYNGTSNEE